MYYNYIYLDPRKPGKYTYLNLNICFLYEPFYVGKGSGDRYKYHLMKTNRVDNIIFKNKLNYLILNNLTPFITIINYTVSEKLSYENETTLIKNIGSNNINSIKNGPLVNVCLYNQPPSLKGKSYEEIYGDRAEEQKEKRKQLQIEAGGWFGGRNHSEESKMKISNATRGAKNPMYGKSHKKETLEKMSLAKKDIYNGSDNPNSKIYEVVSPNGMKYIVNGELKKFCEEKNISYSTLCKCLKTNKMPNSGKTKGWFIKLLNKI